MCKSDRHSVSSVSYNGTLIEASHRLWPTVTAAPRRRCTHQEPWSILFPNCSWPSAPRVKPLSSMRATGVYVMGADWDILSVPSARANSNLDLPKSSFECFYLMVHRTGFDRCCCSSPSNYLSCEPSRSNRHPQSITNITDHFQIMFFDDFQMFWLVIVIQRSYTTQL